MAKRFVSAAPRKREAGKRRPRGVKLPGSRFGVVSYTVGGEVVGDPELVAIYARKETPIERRQ